MVEGPDNVLPIKELRDILLPAFGPCSGFHGACRSMLWIPERGHVPRGFCGATGALREVQLVLVVAEPGDPHAKEVYAAAASPSELFESVCRYVYGCFAHGTDQFHRNIRQILHDCWPDLSLHEQLRRTWITESVLCSASVECGPVSPDVHRNCLDLYLARELALFPNATVVALGVKAHHRMKPLRRSYLRVGSVAPPGCNKQQVRGSWQAISAAVHADGRLTPMV
jgi:hypothetical protein